MHDIPTCMNILGLARLRFASSLLHGLDFCELCALKLCLQKSVFLFVFSELCVRTCLRLFPGVFRCRTVFTELCAPRFAFGVLFPELCSRSLVFTLILELCLRALF